MSARPSGPKLTRQGLSLALLAMFALLTVIIVHAWLSPHDRELVVLVGLVVLTSTALLATVQRARQPKPESLGWKVLALYLLISVFIQGTRIPTFLGYHWPTLVDQVAFLLLLTGSCLQVTALLVWSLGPRSKFDRIRHGLDGLLFALAVFFVLWGLVLGPAFLSDRFPIGARFLWLEIFLVYALLLGLTVYLGMPEPSRFRGPLGWLACAFLMAGLFNFDHLMQQLSGTAFMHFPIGSNFVIPLAYLGAALSQQPVGSSAPPPENRMRIIYLLPYLPVLGATALGIWLMVKGTGSGHQSILVWLALGLVVVLLIRQYLALNDLSVLSQHLESRVRDRTLALEKAQAILLKTERLNSLATLGAGLAHDMNNLLSAVQGRAELVIMDLDEGRLPARQDLVQVLETTRRAASLSGRLMAMGRLEPEPLQVMDLVEELAALRPLLQVLLPGNQVLLMNEPIGPMPFLGRRGMLEQILVNLVSNARDAMPAGGSITIRARPSGTEERALGPQLEIEDTGNGIPEELQGQVFQPFFTTKPSGRGTGLGLVSVKSLLVKDGGTIRFVSQAGQGTTFQIRLPRVPDHDSIHK